MSWSRRPTARRSIRSSSSGTPGRGASIPTSIRASCSAADARMSSARASSPTRSSTTGASAARRGAWRSRSNPRSEPTPPRRRSPRGPCRPIRTNAPPRRARSVHRLTVRRRGDPPVRPPAMSVRRLPARRMAPPCRRRPSPDASPLRRARTSRMTACVPRCGACSRCSG